MFLCEEKTIEKNLVNIAFHFDSGKGIKWRRIEREPKRVNRKNIMTKMKARIIKNGFLREGLIL